MHSVIITIPVQPGTRDKVADIWYDTLYEMDKANKDAKFVILVKDDADENVLRLVELYTSAGAFDSLMGTPEVGAFIAGAGQYLGGEPTFQRGTPVHMVGIDG